MADGRRLQDLSDDEAWERWRRDVEAIYLALVETFSFRRTFRDLMTLFRENERLRETGGHLWGWARACYATTVYTRIRQHVDGQNNEVCLVALLRELEQRPTAVTRQRIVDRGGMENVRVRAMLSEGFTDRWAGRPPDRDCLDPAIPRRDREELIRQSERAARFANVRVAHNQRVGVEALTVAEVDVVLDVIEATFCRYYALLGSGGLSGLEPTPQFDTHAVYGFAWSPRDDLDEH